MEVYVIATIRTTSNVLKGYRLIDISNKQKIDIKDVTKQQLLFTLKKRILKVENAKHNGEKIMGIYSPIDSMPSLVCSNNINELGRFISNNNFLVLKQLNYKGNIVGACITNYKGDVKNVSLGDLLSMIRSKRIINAMITPNGLEIKAKSEEVEPNIKENKEEATEIITDQEAKDVNTIWNIKRFMQYMEQNNYSYVLTDINNSIINEKSYTFMEEKYETLNNKPAFILKRIDPRCKILHIPENIVYLQDVFEFDGTYNVDMDTIIIPKTVINLSSIVEGVSTKLSEKARNNGINFSDVRWLDVETLWYQNVIHPEEDVVTSRNVALHNINIHKKYNLPISENSCYNLKYNYLYNNCDIPYIPKFEKYNVENIDMIGCFRQCKITGAVKFLDLTNLKNIKSSFHSIYGLERVIVGNTIKTIDGCFNPVYDDVNSFTIENPEINFKSNSLNIIRDSFGYKENIDQYDYIDLSEATDLINITSIFKIAPLKEVIFSDSIKHITDSFNNIVESDKKIEMPKNITRFDFACLGGRDNLDWSKSCKSVMDTSLVEYTGSIDELIISDNFTKISYSAFKYVPVNKIARANNIREIGSSAFVNSHLKEFDSAVFPKLKIISLGMLSDCGYLRNIAIQNNIERIEQEAFANCPRLQRVFIGDNIDDLNSDIFNKSGTQTGTIKLYVVKGSTPHLKFKNRKNIIVMAYDSYDEAYAQYLGIGSATENQKNKFKILMGSNTEYKELLNEPYLSNCQTIMNMLNEHKKNEVLNRFQLDTNNLEMNGPTLDYVMHNKTEEIANLRKELPDSDKFRLEDRFINYCNLLTKLGKNHNKIFDIKNKDVYKTVISRLIRVCYIDRYSSILVLEIKHINNIIDYIAIIEINNIVVWSSMFVIDRDKSFIIAKSNCILNTVITKGINNNKLSTYIKPGDTFSQGSENILGGCRLPVENKYNNLWKYIVDNNIILLGCDKELSGRKKSTYILTWYDLTTTEIITTKQSLDILQETPNCYGSLYKIEKPDNFTVLSKYKLDTVLKNIKSKDYNIEKLVNGFNDKVTLNNYKMLSISDDEITELYNKDDAYDRSQINNDNKLLSLATKLRNSNIKHIGQLDKDTIQQVLESDFCFKLNNSLQQAFDKLGSPDIIPLCNGQNMLMTFEIKDTKDTKRFSKYYAYAVTSFTSDTTKVKLYMSYIPILSLVYKIASLAEPLEGKPLYEINDEPINTNDFTFLLTKTSRYRYGTTYKAEVAIQHQTMEVFIITNCDDIDYYPIFRFKSFKDADKALYEFVPSNQGIQGERNIDGGTDVYKTQSFIRCLIELTEIIKKLKIEGMELKENEKYFDFYYIREIIKSGIPNNYPLLMDNSEFIEKLAKQPRK